MEFLQILKKIFDSKNDHHNIKFDYFGIVEVDYPFKFFYLKKLYPFIKPYWKIGVFASLMLIFSALLSLCQPLFTKYIIDDVIVSSNILILTIIVAILIVVLFLDAITSFLKQFYFYNFEQHVIFEIQYQLFQRVLRFPKSFFDSNQTGYLMSRLFSDVFRVRLLFSGTAVEVFTNILKFLGGIIILLYLHWKLTLLSLIILPFFFIVTSFLSNKTRRLCHNAMEKSGQLSKNLQETIVGVNLIKSFATEKKESRKILTSFKDSMTAGIEQNMRGGELNV